MLAKNYRLKDGSICWNKLYFDKVPKFLTQYSPPFGSYNWAYYLYQPHKYFINLWDEIKWFVQRGRRGWSDRDVWGWHYHHATMMVGVIKYLRKHKHGHPIGLTPKQWEKKLNVMEEGFQALLDEENDVTSYKQLSMEAYTKLRFKRQKKLMLGLKYFRIYYQNLWD